MLSIDLKGKRALVAGVADDGGFGFAIAKSLVSYTPVFALNGRVFEWNTLARHVRGLRK